MMIVRMATILINIENKLCKIPHGSTSLIGVFAEKAVSYLSRKAILKVLQSDLL